MDLRNHKLFKPKKANLSRSSSISTPRLVCCIFVSSFHFLDFHFGFNLYDDVKITLDID